MLKAFIGPAVFFLNFEKSNNLLLLVLPFVLLYKCMNRPQRFGNLVNSSGILVTDTWPYYKRTSSSANWPAVSSAGSIPMASPAAEVAGMLPARRGSRVRVITRRSLAVLADSAS